MRTVRPIRRLLVGALVPVLLVGLAACSSDEGEPSASDTAPTATASGSATVSASPTEETDAAEETGETRDKDEFIASMKAAMGDGGSTHMTMEMTGAQSMSAEGDVRFGDESPAMVMTMEMPAMGAQAIEIRMVDDLMYMSMPPMTPEGKFVRIDPNDPNDPLGGAGMGDLSEQMDPRHTFDAFEAGLREVRFVGEEPVSGETLDHYELTLDFAAAAKAQGIPETSGMPETIVYDVWLDDEDLMRRVTFDLGGQVSMDLTMSDWGKQVDVSAPRPNQIVEMPGTAG